MNLSNITLGQFLPGTTPIHRLDPRMKILLTLGYIIAVFLAKGVVGYAAIFAFLLMAAVLSRIPIAYLARGLKPLRFILVLTFLLNLFMTGMGGNVLFKWWILEMTDLGLSRAVYFSLRLILLILGTSLLTLTTSPIALTDGLERLLAPLKKIKFPVHELSMMMTIALRFIPTLLEETDKIMKAQAARGADFDTGNLLQKARSMVPLLVPLFVSAFRRAGDLALAMEARCYRGGEGRTRLHVLRFTRLDVFAALIMFVLFALIGLERFL